MSRSGFKYGYYSANYGRRSSSARVSSGGIVLVLVIGAISALLSAIGALLTLLLTYWYVLAVIGLIIAIPLILKELKKQREVKEIAEKKSHLQKLLSSLIELLDDNEECWSSIDSLRSELKGKVPDLQEITSEAYFEILSRILADGVVTQREKLFLSKAEKALGLEPNLIADAKKKGYLHYYRVAISDGMLTEEEEKDLGILRLSLGIDDSLLVKENRVLDDLADVRSLKADTMKEVECSTTLKKGEHCFHEAACDEYRRTRTDGVYDYKKSEQGELHLTDQRIIFHGTGSFSIGLRDMISIRYVELIELLEITRDGRQTPYYFRIDKPILAMQHVRILKEKQSDQQ